MFVKLIAMYTYLFVVILSTSGCFCYAGYELFQGFITDVDDTPNNQTQTFLDSFIDRNSKTSQITSQTQQNPLKATTVLQNLNTRSPILITSTTQTSTNTEEVMEPTSRRPMMKFICPEEERPSNIGPYEIPTQRDMVLFTRNTLLDMLNSFYNEAFYLLKDIRAVTKATSNIEKKCGGNKTAYKQCVKLVSRQHQETTKSLVKIMENRKQVISNLLNTKICNLSQMTTDPIDILKSIAQDKITLQFTLPGFLRLLSACSLNCVKSALDLNFYVNEPLRHMTDHDLVTKHLLTRTNYLELLMDSRRKPIANSN